MPFDLICDGQPVPLGDRRYLLSPQDLAAVDLLPTIIRTGVASIKIEGRLKSPEYVAAITRLYRNALERLGARSRGEACGASSTPAPNPKPDWVTAADRYEMEMAFSRGLYTGWLRGVNNQALVHARFGKKRGVFLGEVRRVQNERVWLRLEGPLKPGDGVVFDAGRPDLHEQGGRVYEVRKARGEAQAGGRRGSGVCPSKNQVAASSHEAAETVLTFGRGDIDFRRVRVGDKVWKTSDPELERRIRRTFDGSHPEFLRPLQMEVHGAAGRPLTLVVRDDLGHRVSVDSALALAPARNQPLTVERLRDQLGRLGGSPFQLGQVNSFLEGAIILPMSELNRLRRESIAKLEELRAQPCRWTLSEPEPTVNCPSVVSSDPLKKPADLIVLVRSLDQLDATLSCGVATIYCELEDPKKYREAVARYRQQHGPAGHTPWPAGIVVAPPRICRVGEEWILKQVRSSEADGYLVRNYDHLEYFADVRRIGDFSLNVANPMAAEHFIRHCGLERVTASYDLNSDQLARLLETAPPDWFEITLHQHMPMFHMEHCVFCAFLSTGTDYTNCGRPCDTHAVELRDRVGAQHPVKADAGCRNTVYNALAQTGAESAARFLALGAHRFRIEFLNESAERVIQTIDRYRRLLQGRITGSEVWRELRLINRLGVTRGQLEKADPKTPKWGEVEW
jgi:putative protease